MLNNFSIIIPFFNGSSYIKETLDSVVSQSYKNWELIVVNDGSNDIEKKLIIDLIESYNLKQVHLYHKTNEDVAVARNYGIQHAQYDWICLLDQDDYFHPLRLEKLNNYLNQNECDVLINDRFKITSENSELDTNSVKSKTRVFQLKKPPIPEILFNPSIMPVDCCIRKEFIAKVNYFNPSLRMSNDWEMMIKLAEINARFLYFKEPLSFYREHQNNTSKNYNGFVKERFEILNQFFMRNSQFSHYKSKAMALAFQESAQPKYKYGEFPEFRKDALEAIKLSPFSLSFKLYKRLILSLFQ